MAKRSKDADFANQDEILLGMLTAVERDSQISQRTMSNQLDVALGLANAYLKRCVRKGWVKIKQVPPRRFAYYLTPKGFAEKSRLTGRYFSASFDFFRRARNQISDLMAHCVRNGRSRIVLAGVSELAEVATLCAHDHPITIVAIVDPQHAGEKFCGLQVQASIASCEHFDAVIITALNRPDQTLQELCAHILPDRVLAPYLLGLERTSKAVVSEAAE